MRIEGVRWELVKLILQFVNRGPWVAKGDKLERAIKITFVTFSSQQWQLGEVGYLIGG